MFQIPKRSVSCGEIRFPAGTRPAAARRILPVFLPFLGCPSHCVYCAQDRQTGAGRENNIELILENAAEKINGDTEEIAFYGGTFTAMPAADRQRCLSFFASMRKKCKSLSARCSTRPDALSPDILAELKEAGIGLIELGIQSFSDRALALSRRGYTGKEAMEGCRRVQEAGFGLGIQLLPGMPGSTPEIFLGDAETALSFTPACMRFYPCLVPEGTVLAQWFKKGMYRPWSQEQTVATLGRALSLAWRAGVPVIRLSVAPEPAFDASVIAGPRHPALGALIQAEALLLSAGEAVRSLDRRPEKLELPRHCQGFLYGDRGSLRPRWKALGLDAEKIVFRERTDALLS